jgi:hypothetical protein
MADFDGSGKLSPSARLNEKVTFGKMTKVSAFAAWIVPQHAIEVD